MNVRNYLLRLGWSFEDKEIFIFYINSCNYKFCKICRIKKQKKTELKLYEYMQMKYNNKLVRS